MRWWRRRREPASPSYPDDGSLPVVGGSDDPARADSAVVAEIAAGGVDLSVPVLVRHHLRLPDELAVEETRRMLGADGYAVAAAPESGAPGGSIGGAPGASPAAWAVRASRTQLLVPLSVAQERSRMAGLAQRLGGEAQSWDVCAPVGPARPVDG